MAIQPLGEEETGREQAVHLPPVDSVQSPQLGGLDIFGGYGLNSPWSQCHQLSGQFIDCPCSGSSQSNKAMPTNCQGKMIFNLETCNCSNDKCEGKKRHFKPYKVSNI